MKSEFKILIDLLLVVVVLFFAFANMLGSERSVEISDHDPVLGQPGAPVTFVMFGDYKCGHTRTFFEETFPKLKEKYIDTGKIKFVYKQLLLGDDSWAEAEASLCANQQGKFWPFISALFESREQTTEENTSSDKYANEIRIALELGLDENEFYDCLMQGANKALIQQNVEEAERLKIAGTPTSLINGLKVEGAVPFEDFESVLSKFSYL